MADTDPAREQLILDTMKRYGLSRADAELSADRRRVYGDPKINHTGIAMAWAGILQPWAHLIARMQPLPPHVVALLMSGVKFNRKRMIFHDDNYADSTVYEGFARAWQKEHEAEGGEQPMVIESSPGPGYELVIEWRKIRDNTTDKIPQVADCHIKEQFPREDRYVFAINTIGKLDAEITILHGIPVEIRMFGRTFKCFPETA